MVTVAAIALLMVAVLVFLAIDHHEDLRRRFGFASKELLPPLSFSQWTAVSLTIAITAVVAAILGLGIVNAGHRIACNARTLSEWVNG